MLKTSRQVDVFSAPELQQRINPRSNRQYRRFNRLLLILTLLPLGGVGAFNIAIDPYGIFHTPTISGINAAKPEKFKQDTLINAIEVIHRKPDVILLGSSRVQWGIKPSHQAFSQEDEVYNLAIQGTNMYEVRRYFEHALHNQPGLKQVVIGLDELMFSEFVKNRPDFDEQRLGKTSITLKDVLNTVLSFDAFGASKQTLRVSRSRPRHIRVGKFTVTPSVFVDGALSLDSSVPAPGSVKRFKRNLSDRLGADREDGRYSNYRVSAEQLAHLRAIVETCQQRGIELKLFISPEHALLFEAMQLAFGAEIEQWKRELVQIAPVWDFSGYNSITTEALRKDMTYYLDSSHYSQKTGKLILNRLFSYQTDRVPDDFGVLITPANIESHLATVRAHRVKWIATHPELAEIVKHTRPH